MASIRRTLIALVAGTAVAVSTAIPAVAAPSATVAAAADTVTVAGTITRVSEGETDPAHALFQVPGRGFLQVDLSRLELASLQPDVTLELERPAAVAAPLDTGEGFAAWAAASSDAPLVARSATLPRATAAMVNRTPVTPAVHKLYAVLATPVDVPGNSPAANQTAAKVQTAVAAASEYWSEQSGGTVSFELMGVTAWYKATKPCYPSYELWNEAIGKATTQLGYREAANTHLVVFLPSGAYQQCGPAGLATIGKDVNTGGFAWVDGTSDDPYEVQTLIHELGHNLSFGHANWLDCPTATVPSFSLMSLPGSCAHHQYGDVVDAMGGGIGDRSAGAFSSPNAIRSGLWPSDAYAVAPVGTGSYVLHTVSGNAGLRSVVVEDTNGVNYFVEYRDYTDEDAEWTDVGCPGWTGDVCVATADGIRVLRLAPESSFKGFPGDGTEAITRTIGGGPKGTFTAGESFTQPSGLSISVTSISGSTATVSITRPASTLKSDSVQIYQTSGSPTPDSTWVVGDRLVAWLGSGWRADTVNYQWYRDGTAISGATQQAYTLTGADVARYMKVKVTGKVGSSSKSVTNPPSPYLGYGPVRGGPLTVGTVVIDNSTTPLAAVTSGWTSGAKFAYQWYRGSTKISGATKRTYTPTTADNGTTVKVKVTGSKSGYTSKSLTSAPIDITVTASGVPAITGTARVGETLGVTSVNYSTVTGQLGSPTRKYQWYRGSTAISKATGATYKLVAADYGTKISVKVTGGAPGWAPNVQKTPATAAVAKGVIQQAGGAYDVIKESTSLVLKAAPSAKITEPGVTYAYQWLRNGKAISKATKSSYTLKAADYGKTMSVRVTVKKKNYTTVVLTSPGHDYSIRPSTAKPVIVGEVALGDGTNVLSLADRTFEGGAEPLAITYQWYRGSTAIAASAGGKAATYTITPKDVGKTLTVKVTVKSPGWLTSTSTSAATPKVGKLALEGWDAQPGVTLDETLQATTRTLTAASTGITEPGVKTTYQWYRGSTKISKATTSTYTLKSADYGAQVWVKVVTSKKNYTTITKSSEKVNYSVLAVGTPVITGTPKIGLPLAVTLPSYTPSDATITYQWYADGKPVTSADGAVFTPDLLQKGSAITVKVTASKHGYLPKSITSAKTGKVAQG